MPLCLEAGHLPERQHDSDNGIADGRRLLMNKPRYRWRTRLRTWAPFWMTDFFPKGRHDCGQHEWYRHDSDTFHCYHCKVGILKTRELPE